MKKNEKNPVKAPKQPEQKNNEKEPRAPQPSSSVGYYDFSADYPGEQRAEGHFFRADAPRRFARWQKLAIAAAVALVFCAAFTVTRVMLHISEKQPGAVGDAPAWATESTVPPPELVTAQPGDG